MDTESSFAGSAVENDEPVIIKCTFDAKIFYNPANKYCIFSMKTADPSIPQAARSKRFFSDHLIRFAVIGYELPMTDAVQLEVEGVWVNGKYGLQLQVDQWNEIVPETEAGIRNYLNSGLLKNVGEKTADEIFDRFGLNSLRVIEREPERLLEIRGITKERLEEIVKAYNESRQLRSIITLLAPFKLTPKAALKIYRFFGPKSVEVLSNSPYSLCQIPGYGFFRVDEIMRKNNCDYHDPMRVRGAIYCALESAKSEGGHLYLERDRLLESAFKFLNSKVLLAQQKISKETIEMELEDMILGGVILSAKDKIYNPKVFEQEDQVAHKVAEMLLGDEPDADYRSALEEAKKSMDLQLSPKQEEAVCAAMRHQLSVITGSPGTGKTTVLKMILAVYARLFPGNRIMLLAPTGCASRRMANSTGFRDAKTMHSALSLFGEDEEDGQLRKESPLQADLIIIDESSMVDMWLAKQFFTRITSDTKVVLVGDADQLKSVGAGNVFKEIMDSGVVPVTVLDHIFRQSGGSFIARNAKIINNGETQLYYGDDFMFIPSKNQEETAGLIMELYCQEVGKHGIENVQILSAFRHRGEASVDSINQELREIMNPFQSLEDEVRVGSFNYRIGDRVMQTKNDYDIRWKKADEEAFGSGIFNGDVGIIRSIDTVLEQVMIQFDDRIASYPYGKLPELELSYATTIHKSQGSEYDVVIIPMLKAQMIMLSRDIFYTAVTRAKKQVILVGQKAALFMAIHTCDAKKRNTQLGTRIGLYYKAMAKSAGKPIPVRLEEKLKKAS